MVLHPAHILTHECLLRLRGVVSGLAEFDGVERLGHLLLSHDLALVPLALSKRVVRLALSSDRRPSDTMNVFDCEVAPLNPLTGILAVSCSADKGVCWRCLVHSC